MAGRFDLALIEAGLETYIIGRTGRNELWDELNSTNDRAIELAQAGAPEGVVVLARQQTGGRGRQGRRWVSPRDSGVFMSMILRPTLDASLLPLISFAGGVAAVEAIKRATNVAVGLKWVNDLVFEGKKVGGILAEMPGAQANARHSHEGWVLPPAVILGIGINLATCDDDVPDEIKGRVCGLDVLSGKEVDANFVVAQLCNAFEEQYNHLRHSAAEIVLAEWRQRSLTLGKRIKATCGNLSLEGTADDITDSGALVLRLDSGEVHQLNAGEITIRLDDGRYA